MKTVVSCVVYNQQLSPRQASHFYCMLSFPLAVGLDMEALYWVLVESQWLLSTLCGAYRGFLSKGFYYFALPYAPRQIIP